MSGNHHVAQFKKNWSIAVFSLTVAFGAGGVWTFVAEDPPSRREFEAHERLHETQLKYIEYQLEEVKEMIRDLRQRLPNN
ncbi:hypothetical protein MYX75_01100 [Acidobacteria bacterium AH-259-A15]|nr:hypothetical protein [Acidobacteria bacterium AH-259-A15]